MDKVNQIISTLDLIPHPDGGYYNEIYRSGLEVTLNGFSDPRSLSTSIYFLLVSEQVSLFHRLKSDEIWYHHQGGAIIIHCLDNITGYRKILLGSSIEKNEMPQAIIASGTIFGAEIENKEAYALVGCMVSPGFNFHDFELVDRKTLLTKFPKNTEIIMKLTKL